jgi:hypothetical protein
VTVMKASDLIKAADVHANRPAANAVPTGALYSCTTHTLIYRTDGTSWSTWATLAAGALDDSLVAPVTPVTPTAGAYTFVLADKHRLTLSTSNSSAATFTVPPNSSVAFPVGCSLTLVQSAAGQITLAAGAGVTLSSAHGLKTSAASAVVAATKIATDTWVVSGDTTT